MYGLCFEGQCRWTHYLLLIIWLLLLAATPPKALGYFLGDTKAVLHGCKDHWTLQDRTAMPLLFQMTVCVDIRVTVPGAWVAFSYSSVHAPRPELGLEGDDKAVYAWLLRVRHRFPVELSPTVWHRVCLRRDVPRNSFSLEVDGKMVAARTVIAQAISPSGFLWLGCRPRDRPPGATLGEVELYMFRMWDDLDDHGVCEDGTVIGWSAQYWGLTSPRARQKDPNLLCDHRRLRREAQQKTATAPAGGRVFTPSPATSSPVTAVTHMSSQTSQVTGSQLINCDIKQFCSQKNAYFWMSISVEAKEGNATEQSIQNLVSDAFGCYGNNSDTASNNMDICQAVEVNCVAKSNISTTTCSVLLQRSVAVSACDVQLEGVSALQLAEGEQIEVKIMGQVERVGRYLCEDTPPSSGGFVRCTSTSSLEDICEANEASTVTCSLIDSDSTPAPQTHSNKCSSKVPRFCDCTAFCNSQRQFFATKINITSDAVNVDRLQSLLSQSQLARLCGTSKCQDILNYYERVHLECHGTQQRLFSCMVILEMSAPVDICSLNEFLQKLNDSSADITTDRPLTHMMICGPPDLSVDTLLKSNLTWVDSDQVTSDLCQPDPTLLECEANEVRAVLLNEGCSHRQVTTQPSTLTSIAATPVTNATEHTTTEAGNAAATEKTNASHSTVQPNVTAPLTRSSTGRPVPQTSSRNTTLSSVNSTSQITTTARIDSTLNTTTLSPHHITVYNETTADTLRPPPNETSTTTPSPTLVNNVTTASKNNTTTPNKVTKAYNVTTAHDNWNLQNGTTAISNTTTDTFTPSPNHTVVYSVTTASNNYTTDYNVMTADQNNDTSTTFSTFTPSPNYTMVNNVTTATTKHTTDSNNYTTVYNVTTASNNYTTLYNVSTADIRNPKNGTNTTNNTTVSTFTHSPKHTAGYNVTTTTGYVTQHNSTITVTNTTISTFTSSPNDTMVNNVTTATNNYTTDFNNYTTDFNNYTTDFNNYTTVDNLTMVDNNGTEENRTTTTSNTTISTFTSSPNDTTVNNVTTATNNYTTDFNNYTTDFNNYTTDFNTYTTVDNLTMVDNNGTEENGTTTTSNTTISTFTTPNPTAVYNVTTSASNNTAEYNSNNRTSTTSNATISTSTSSPNYTMANNATTATKNYTTHFNNYTTPYNISAANIRSLQNGTTTTRNTTISTFTPSPNHTEVYNKTTTSSYVRQHNSTVTTADATISTFTSSPNYTMVNNVTTVDNNGKQQNTTNTSNTTISTYTTSPKPTVVYNATTAASNYTTQYNATTPSNNYTTQYNATTASNNYTTQYNVTTPSNNYTTQYNATTASNNYTTQYNATTASNNYTTQYNVTTADNIRNLQNGTTTTRNTTFSTFTPSPSHTAGYNLTTTSSHNSTITTTNTTMSTFTTSNYTVVSKKTTATKNYTTAFNNYTAVYNTTADNNNGTITTSNTTISTFTPSPSVNYTTVNNVTTVSHKYTTAENVTTTTVSQNNRTTYNVTTATPHKNLTTSAAETLHNAATSKNMTAVVDNTTKPTVAPLNNQTANHTTASMTYTTTSSKTDPSSTTAASGSAHHRETTGSLSTTTSSLTTDLTLTTKRPVSDLTTTVPSTTRPPPLATTATTTATTSTTTPTTATTPTTTITSTSTTTTKPDTGATSTTTTKTTQSQEAQEQEANELLVQTQDASQLNSSQVAQLAGQLEKLLDGPTVSQAVGQKAVNIISNLMEGDSLALTASANRLIRVVDDLGLKLVVTGDKEIVSSSSLVLAVRTVDGANFPTTSVDIFSTDNVQLSGISRSRIKRSASALGSVYLPSSLTTGLRPEEQQQASRVQFTYYTKSALFQDATLDNKTSVSPILGSSVANLSISNLSENIRFTIRNVEPLQKNYTASCVYWDFTLNDGLGGWSSNGCFVVNATSEGTTCSCNHLTSFAILLDLSRDGVLERQQAQILTFITYIGCGLSAIFLAVTLLTYLSFEKLLRDIPAKILVQLCISLLLLNLLFLMDGWLALYPATGLCISTAFFLHYFLLTSFTWAGLEALHMYLSVIRVFTPYLSRYMLKFSLMGWGIPLIVVIVVISVDKDNYGLVTYGKYTDGTTDDFCWLRNNTAFYVAVVGYFVLIFALCLLVFIMVMVQLARIKRQNPQNQAPNRGVMTDMRSIAGLVILLGLTWGFALFAWGPLYLPFVYLFTIFNTLQGFLVFVFHCAVKENVRRQWRTYLCCGRLRLAENSEWSRTATQNTRNISSSTATTSAPRHPSRSSSVISEGTNSNGSVFLDSGISDCTGSDVILNEIHRQNMSL